MSDHQTSTRRLAAIQTPQSVIVAATLPTHQAAFFDALKAAGLSDQAAQSDPCGQPQLISQDQIGDLAEVSDWMAEHPQGHLLLLMRLPVVAVARRLGEGMAPKTALAQWLESAQPVLAVIRRHRRRVSLLFAEPALADTPALLDTVSQRLQLQLQEVPAQAAAPALPSAVLRMMAENAIWQSSEARNLAAELTATALPLRSAQNILLPAIDQVFAEYRHSVDTTSRVELEKTRQKLQQVQHKAQTAEELKEENELLLTQLHQVQEELQSHFLQAKQSEEKLAQAQKQYDQLRKQLESAGQESGKNDPALQDLQEENELLLQQLHHVQEELEHYYLQSTQQASPWQDTAELHAAHDTIRAIYNSYSWRLTRPLRWFLRVFGAGPAASEKQPLPDTVEAAHDTIQALKNSKSWKITKPLRIFS
ncbi:hypothetical protein [Wenzhouxiangella limi]|uniref:Uncharacterized protein n=1 Tax=Wenzhouxiangella limi TaxID=2707351 RepID=A0A845VGF3_9GAMM|nr:hypothetical protein [Wenzhouxiangella limi]NDY96289.1 hypothetical protein [Wenzhouxiangella limi]